jgi:predicted nucleic acid-binding protein
LDNSVTASWCFEDQSTSYTESVLQAVDGASIVVPAIWRLEIVNAPLVAERRKKIAPTKSAQFLYNLQLLAISVDTEGLDHVFGEVFDQARRYQRTAYDASYLELANRRALPLATRDEPLRNAAEEFGLSIFQP